MKKSAAALIVLTLTCKLIGFVKEAVVANYFGTSYIVDAFTMVDSILVILCGWIVALATVYIPSYIRINKEEGKHAAENFTNSIIKVALGVSIFFIIVIIIFREQIVLLFASSASEKMRDQMQIFLQTSIICMIFLVIYRIAKANMDSRGRYILGGIVDFLISIIMLAGVFIAGILNHRLLAYVLPVSNGIAAVICVIFLYQTGFRFHLFAKLHPAVKATILSAIPMLLNILIMDVTTMTDKLFAASLAEGSIATLTYASLIEGALCQIIGVSIVTVLYPAISESLLNPDRESFETIYSRGINSIIILFVPIMTAITLLSSNLIAVIYQRGNFSAEATCYTQSLLQVYIWGSIGVVFRDITSRVMVAKNHTKTVFFVGLFTTIFNIALDFILIHSLGAKGLALATTLSILAGIPIYLWKGRDWITENVYKRILPVLLKSIAATTIMSIYILIIRFIIMGLAIPAFIENLAILLVSAAGGIPIYFLVMNILHVNEVSDIMKNIKRKIGRK